MKPNHPLEVRGWFLSFTDEEIGIIEKAFEEIGYDLTVEGLKEFILDSIEALDETTKPDAVDGLVKKVASIVKENPETVRAYAGLAGNMIGNFIKKKAGIR